MLSIYQQSMNPVFFSGAPYTTSPYPHLDSISINPLSRGGNVAITQSDPSRNVPPPAKYECCKVHLWSLKHAATSQDAQRWARSRMGERASAIVHINVPMDHQKGRIGGRVMSPSRAPQPQRRLLRCCSSSSS